MKSAGELPRSVRTRTRTQQSGTRTRSLVIEYEYHRKRLSTSTNARQIELTISGSFQAAARLSTDPVRLECRRSETEYFGTQSRLTLPEFQRRDPRSRCVYHFEREHLLRSRMDGAERHLERCQLVAVPRIDCPNSRCCPLIGKMLRQFGI